MATREIIEVGDPRLRTRSRPIKAITPDIRQLVDDMVETMHANNGIGLAAVQVGELVRVIIVELPEDEEDVDRGHRYIVLNPEIVKLSRETEVGIEGCLSVPGYVGEVDRSTMALIRGMDINGKKFRLRARGFLARVFQHEIDHCNGILYIDRLTETDRIWEVTKGEEEQVEIRQQLPQDAVPTHA
jgi:peptide deformylase